MHKLSQHVVELVHDDFLLGVAELVLLLSNDSGLLVDSVER